MNQPRQEKQADGLSRREFLGSSAFVGGMAAFASQLVGCRAFREMNSGAIGSYALADPKNTLYTTCLQCHLACPIKVRVWEGTPAKLTGSPYSPQNYLPHLPYETSPDQAAPADGKLDVKGQSGVQTYGDPYRLRRVLKRQGPRGSNKWRVVEFNQFIEEVVTGGKLFAEIGDERHYPGFDEVYALRDRDLARRMAADAKKVGAGTMTLAAFKQQYSADLDKLIDPDHPDLGPKNNGFVFQAGRIEHGRKELMKWFTHDSFGSNNAYEHTTICEQSHHIAFKQMTGKTHMKPDLLNCEFVLFWGTGAFSANFGLTCMAEKVTTGTISGRLKTAVVDPRLSNDAGKADWWLPVKPGADGALAQWMIRWILENKRYDARYLANANKAAAQADHEPTWTNATHLVKIVDGHPLQRMTAAEAGVGSDNEFVVSHRGKLLAVADDPKRPVEGDLLVDATVNGTKVKSAFQLLWDEAFGRTPDQYARITGLPPRLVEEVARELTSHGKRAAVDMYRGAVQHTDGFHTGCAIVTLNMLIGNFDWKGGLQVGGGHWHESGGKAASIYNFKKMHPAKMPKFGPPISREKSRYEDSSLFRDAGYPAKRPWYPFTGNLYQEIIPSFAQGYPYKGRILFLHKGTPALASPAGDKVIGMLEDPAKVPLFISSDIVIGETTMYADYIVPDVTYFERWATPHATPDVPTKTSKVRQPVAKPLTEEVEVDGERMPLCLETFLIAVAKKLNMPGFGRGAFVGHGDFHRSEDWFLKLVANIAVGDKAGERVPDADDAELALFRQARRHLPPSVFDETKWKRAVLPELWRKVVYVLNRGGRFASFGTTYDGEYMKSRFGKAVHLFMDDVAGQRNSLSGKFFIGYPAYRGQYDSSGKPLDGEGAYSLALITFKEPIGGQSRTISNYWGNIALKNENAFVLNPVDARRLGLADGQLARLRSTANPQGVVDLGNGGQKELVAKVAVSEGIRPGAVAVSWHYGHWAYGSADVIVNGRRIVGDRRRAAGICPNHAMAVDPILKDVCLTDPIGGSASFNDTFVTLTPAVSS
ncbi:MAG: molybdopterin-dependent oxidoreductase [Kiritimatiellaeota bacterium]|nr:molybdopterin-dependent oxidoreductase [Kiritimatiellota bacterium]